MSPHVPIISTSSSSPFDSLFSEPLDFEALERSAKYRPRVTPASGQESEFHVVHLADGTTRRFPRVTTLINVVGKSWLRTWVAKVTREDFRQAAMYSLLSTQLGGDSLIDREAARRMIEALRPGDPAERLRISAAAYGTAAHRAAEHVLRGGVHVESTDPHLENTHAAWADWWSRAGLTVIDVEQKVSCLQCGYAGSLDVLARDATGKVWVIDHKTSKKFDSSFVLQLAAYRHASPIPADGAMLVKLPKGSVRGKVLVKTYSAAELDEGFKTFLAAKQVWTWLRVASGEDPGDPGLGGHYAHQAVARQFKRSSLIQPRRRPCR